MDSVLSLCKSGRRSHWWCFYPPSQHSYALSRDPPLRGAVVRWGTLLRTAPKAGVVLWEDSVALEVVLQQQLGDQVVVEEAGWLHHTSGSHQERNTPPK